MASQHSGGVNRRSFVQATTAAVAASCLTGQRGVAQSAGAVPPPAESVQAGGGGERPNAQPWLTPAEQFRTVARGNPKPHTLTGQALLDARLTAATWRLEITADPAVAPPRVNVPAAVERSLTIAAGTALDLPRLLELGKERGVKYIKAMQCLNIDTPLGQGLWEGVPLRNVLGLCGRLSNVRRIYYRGFHNNDPEQIFQSSLSYTQVMETPPGELPVFLAYRLNGQPIPLVRGGPVRMIVPWAHGFKSIKWLREIYLTNEYQANDTYALKNNDPESYLKTAAYVDPGPARIASGEPAVLRGRVIHGLSGLERVEYWLRRVNAAAGDPPEKLADDDPELLRGPWHPCELDEPPAWAGVLPPGVSPRDLLGFDRRSGEPLSWPPRYAMASYHAVIRGLEPGHYEARARAVDGNGFAQPEPRPLAKSGRNGIQVWRFEVA